ncbi:9499_t:CDS:2, partial [Gigaspora rosea]
EKMLGITIQSKRKSSRKTKKEWKGQQRPQERIEPIVQEWGVERREISQIGIKINGSLDGQQSLLNK